MTDRPVLGLLHPGQMGASLGAAARAANIAGRVLWAGEGRGGASRARAEAAGLEETATLADLVREADAILSVVPPHAAPAQAEAVMAAGYAGLYVDANAIAPATARAIGGLVSKGGARYVDGGIIGPPAERAGTTRLYLSGETGAAREAASLFAGSIVETPLVGEDPGAASALKMCYAAYTKGTSALLIAVRALARAEGVDAALLAEWERSQPGVAARSEAAPRRNASKAWRFVGEMAQIAASFEAHGLPSGFHQGAGELYAALEPFKDSADPGLESVLESLLRRPGGATTGGGAKQ